MRSVRQLTGVAAFAAAAVALTAAPAHATLITHPLASVQVVSTGPLPVTAPGTTTVRLRLHGGPQGSAAGLSLVPTSVAVPRVQGSTAAVREVHLEGTGGRVFWPRVPIPAMGPAGDTSTAESRAVADQACRRGRYDAPGTRSVSFYRNIQVDPGQTVDVVAAVDVPAGLAGVPAGLTVRTTQIVEGDWDAPRVPTPVVPASGPTPGFVPLAERAAENGFTIPIPRTGPAHDVVTLVLGDRDRAGKRVRLRGSIVPPREGAVVEIGGRRTPNTYLGGEVLGHEDIATAPIGPRMRYFGEAKTDANGRWATWVTLPPRVAVVARTAEVPGVSLGGASCGLWFSSPTLDQRALDAKRKADAKRRRDAQRRAG